MSKFIVRYSLDGEAEIEAESAEEAQSMFEAMSMLDLAENADFTADDPKTPEQLRQEIASFMQRTQP